MTSEESQPIVKSNLDGSVPEGVPSAAEQQNFIDTIRKFLNPLGTDKSTDQYINNTFSYILGAMYKMGAASDKDAAAQEIAEELKEKCENWLKEWKKNNDIDEAKEEEKKE